MILSTRRKNVIRKRILTLECGDWVEWWAARGNIKQGKVFQVLGPGETPSLDALAYHGSVQKMCKHGVQPRGVVSYIVAVPGLRKPAFYWPDSRKLSLIPEGELP